MVQDAGIPALMSARRAAEVLGVSSARVRQLAAEGTLPGQRVDDAGWVFRVDMVSRFAAGREVQRAG